MLKDSLFWSLSRIRQRGSRTSHNVERLNLEQLEQRVLLSTSILNPLQDNTLYEDAAGTISNGEGDYFFAGNTGQEDAINTRRGLVQFDIAESVPAGADIVSVNLALHMSRTISGAQNVDLHRVTAEWGEGASNAPGQEGAGIQAQTGDATWKHTFSPTETWTTLGGDFDPTVSAMTSVSGFGSYIWNSIQLAADVQAWLDNPTSNFGWIVIGNETTPGTAKRFDTRENSIPANRPILTIEYVLPNNPPTVANPIDPQTTPEDAAFNFTLPSNTFADADNDTLTLSALLADNSSLPTWLSFDGSSFTGTPLNDNVGSITIKVTADDGNGGTVSDEFTLTVSNTNDPPIVANPIPDQTANENILFAFTLPPNTYADEDGDTLTLSALLADDTPLPAWLNFDGAAFTGTPANADAGTFTVKVTADDGNTGSVSDEFTLTVVVSPMLQIILDTDRGTVEPSRFEFISEEDGQLVIVTLKGTLGTIATLILTPPDQLDHQRLVSVNLASLQPDRTSFSAKTKGFFTIEAITGNGAKMLDLKNATLIGNSINMTGPVGKIRLNAIADGSHILLGGSPADTLTLEVTGNVGTAAGSNGVDLIFGGQLKKVVARAWHSGQWNVDSVGKVQITAGDFSPAVNIAGAFKDFQITGGDLLSPEFLSGPGG
ncbi:MAG: DNRLRE domain-containing protein, partial [Planctomycetes bacterium]|nr:DNRLRE domain-containing protein [Planctomycetota bacterium]